MKKIVLALDGDHFPQGAFALAAMLHQQQPVLVTGVFLSPVDISKIVAYTGLEAVPLMPDIMDGEYAEKIRNNIEHFKAKCDAEGMEYRIHNDSDNLPIASLIKESRFADLIFICRDTFFSNISQLQPNEYMQELLKKSECPVVVVPSGFTPPEEVVVMYDGEASSVFALKQFAYLLPEMAKLPVTLLQLTASGSEAIKDQAAVSELAARHFPDLTLEELHLENKSVFPALLQGEKKTMLVMGAYGRSVFSHLFKKSFADEIIQTTEVPVFIAHR